MGGSVGEGNRTPAAEFNIWADPEAARRVFESGIDITMIGLDVTHQALVTDADAEAMRGLGKVGKVAAELFDFYGRWHRRPTPTSTAPRCTTRSPSRTSSTRPSSRRSRRTSRSTAAGSRGEAERTSTGAAATTRSPPNATVGLGIDNERVREADHDRLASLG